jgi:class 3 adenylate cyclase
LQDSVKISAELPPAEYFELINEMWKVLSASFERFHGIHGKHAGDGMLYYFIKKPGTHYIRDAIFCAMELKERLRKVSQAWKARKGWLNELYLNIGINEGKEFFGTIRSNSTVEFTALGDSINYAGRLSDLARFGGIMVTKNTINRLGPEDIASIRYGIRRNVQGREIFIENTFSRVQDLLDPDSPQKCKYQDIAMLPVTEIAGLMNPGSMPSSDPASNGISRE